MSGLERDALVAKTVEIMPAITEDMIAKDILLQKLQTRIYFEKTITASTAANYAGPCSMALPAWFVAQHSDKFRTSVLLRSGLSPDSCRVELTLGRISRSRPEVRLSTGFWKPFAIANDLAVGDSLIFCLRAMSEFDVYIFRETKSPIQPTSVQAPRKRSHDFELPEAKVKKYYVGRKRRKLVAERHSSRVVSETVEGKLARTGSRVKETPVRGLQEKISFAITLSHTATSARCRLTLPRAFVKQHGNKIQKYVVLSVANRKMWTVNVHIYYPANVYAQVVFDGCGWKGFVVSNGLAVGDRLTFTLLAMSKFEVLIFRSSGNAKAVPPSVRGPVRRSKGSVICQTRQPPKPLGPQQKDLIGECSVEMERELSGELFAEKEESEDSVAHSASDSSKP